MGTKNKPHVKQRTDAMQFPILQINFQISEHIKWTVLFES